MNDFSELKGRHIVSVEGLEPDSESATFHCADGSEWRMYHGQDCCESVSIVDVVGDVADLIDAGVLDAREETNSDSDPEDYAAKRTTEDPDWNKWRDSYTWTFYIIQTTKGAVTIRWLGESNGYYCEVAQFDRVDGGRPI